MALELPIAAGWTTFIVGVLTILGIGAGLWVFNRFYFREIGNIQERVIAAYKEQTAVMTTTITTLSTKVTHLQAILTTIQFILHAEGIDLSVEDDLITLRQTGARKRVTMRVPPQLWPHLTHPVFSCANQSHSVSASDPSSRR